MNEADKKKTAFITKYGLFHHTRILFGLCNAPATFQRMVNLVLRGMTWKEVLEYIDDVLVLGTSFESHIANLRAVLLRFRDYHPKLKPKKCLLFQVKIEFRGRVVSRQGITTAPSKTEAILKCSNLQAFKCSSVQACSN